MVEDRDDTSQEHTPPDTTPSCSDSPPCPEHTPPCSDTGGVCSHTPACSDKGEACEHTLSCPEHTLSCPEHTLSCLGDAPSGEKHTPSGEKHTPSGEKHTPSCSGDSPPPPTLSGQLRADLCMTWTLGFLDAMKGEDVTEDDMILSDMAEPLAKLSQGCIDNAASLIAQVIDENPSTVYQVVYSVGHDLYSALAAAYGPTEINLN